MSSKATLRTRAATSVDIPAITSLLISALDQDPLFNFNFPHRKEYPQDCFQSWQRILSTWVYEPWVAFLVAEIEEHEEWKIVAFARWSIQPDLVVWDVEQTKLMNSSGWVEWGWSMSTEYSHCLYISCLAPFIPFLCFALIARRRDKLARLASLLLFYTPVLSATTTARTPPCQYDAPHNIP